MSFPGPRAHFCFVLNAALLSGWASLFIHSPTEVHLGCFQALGVMREATINIHVQVLVWRPQDVLRGRGGPAALSDTVTSHYTGVPDLRDLMPDDLRWGCCANNREKVHKKCDAFKSSQNHPPCLVYGKITLHEIGAWCPKGWGPLSLRPFACLPVSFHFSSRAVISCLFLLRLLQFKWCERMLASKPLIRAK